MRLSKREFEALIKCYTKLDNLADDIYNALGISGEMSKVDESLNDMYMFMSDICGYNDEFWDKRENSNRKFDPTELDKYLFEDYKVSTDDLYDRIMEEISE